MGGVKSLMVVDDLAVLVMCAFTFFDDYIPWYLPTQVLRSTTSYPTEMDIVE